MAGPLSNILPGLFSSFSNSQIKFLCRSTFSCHLGRVSSSDFWVASLWRTCNRFRTAQMIATWRFWFIFWWTSRTSSQIDYFSEDLLGCWWIRRPSWSIQRASLRCSFLNFPNWFSCKRAAWCHMWLCFVSHRQVRRQEPHDRRPDETSSDAAACSENP